MNLTACIITDGKKNKELVKCINSLKCCKEIIIGANNNSYDCVKELFKKNFRVRVVNQIWKENFSKARNEILELACMDWILTIDSDEMLETEIMYLDPQYDFYLAVQENNGEDYWNGRVFKNHKGYYYKNIMHESLEHHMKKGNYARSNIKIAHSGYEISNDELEQKLERNYKLMLKDKGNPVRNYHLGNYEYLKNHNYKKALKYYSKAMKDKVNAEHKASILNCIYACQTLLKYDTRITMNTLAQSLKILPLQKQARVHAVEHLVSVLNEENKKNLIPVIEKELDKIESIELNKSSMLYSDLQLEKNYLKNKRKEFSKWQ